MKLYTRDQFMKLPAGTLYVKGVRWDVVGGPLLVKGEACGRDDWLCFNPMRIESEDGTDETDRLAEMLAGTSYPMADEPWGRDGCFNDRELFLVPEADDLVRLRGLIDAAIAVAREQGHHP